MMLGTITRMLRNRHDVTALGDATAAFELLRTDHFDVVLSDLHMPRLNAAQLHECLVRDGNAHADRMLLMTGGAMSPESSAFVERMAGRVLEKPFTVQALLAIVQQFAAAPS